MHYYGGKMHFQQLFIIASHNSWFIVCFHSSVYNYHKIFFEFQELKMDEILYFASDYQEGAHPSIINKLCETNMLSTSGYGTDEFCESARALIKKACKCPKARVDFLIGGTQTNATVIDSMLRPYEGVIAAHTGHIATHEAGAIEAGAHKVLTLKGECGKISASAIEECLLAYSNDENREHTVKPGMVYISQPTEYGTLYSKKELTDISAVCKKYKVLLYVDGARLAYALGSDQNDVDLADLAKYCDAFYIGGTKCGALFGEAVVLPDPELIPHFFTLIKQHGALLAKGRLLGIQFQQLFTDGLYYEIGKEAVKLGEKIKKGLLDSGYKLFFDSPTNQIFAIFENSKLKALSKKVTCTIWEKFDENHTVIRFATSWATTDAAVKKLLAVIESL